MPINARRLSEKDNKIIFVLHKKGSKKLELKEAKFMISLIEKIVSGGQTGVDRAALDVAILHNIPYGGWCPKGRKAEDGIIPTKYILIETNTDDYTERTLLNIRDSDGTLILLKGTAGEGTLLTIEQAKVQKKPLFVCDLKEKIDPANLHRWIKNNFIKTLNIAGNRATQTEDIYHAAFDFLNNFIDYKMFGS